jgi:putative flippase GtrA
MDFKKLIRQKFKFGLFSGIATLIDYLVYLSLVYFGLQIVTSHIISYSCGAVVNFIFQKKYIFSVKKRVHIAFVISISFSLLGLALSSVLIAYLKDVEILNTHPILPKIIVTAVIFFYNFYTKRFAFEGFSRSKNTNGD